MRAPIHVLVVALALSLSGALGCETEGGTEDASMTVDTGALDGGRTDSGPPDAGDTGPVSDAGDSAMDAADSGLASDAGGDTGDADSGVTFLETVEERLDHLGVGRRSLDQAGGTVLQDFAGNPGPPLANPIGIGPIALSGGAEFYVHGAGDQGSAVMVDLDRPSIRPSAGEHVIKSTLSGYPSLIDPVVLNLHDDDDGREEVYVAYRDGSGADANIRFLRINDEATGYGGPATVGSAPIPGATQFDAVAWEPYGDSDPNSSDDVLVAAYVGGEIKLASYDTGLFLVALPITTISDPIPDADIGTFERFDMASGDMDGVPGDEVALIVRTASSNTVGKTYVFVIEYDGDEDHCVANRLCVTSWVEAFIPMNGGAVRSTGVAVADIDGDYRGEIIVAGIDSGPDSEPSGELRQRLVVLDDSQGQVQPISTRLFIDGAKLGGQQTVRVRDTQIHVARTSTGGQTIVDAPADYIPVDPIDDLLINNVLWEYQPADGGGVEAMAPKIVFGFDQNETELVLDEATVQFAAGQLNADGFPDVAVLTKTMNLFDGVDRDTLTVTSLGVGAPPRQTAKLTPNGPRMILRAANMDDDGIVVEYDPTQHGLVYSEPLILAAIAAPPCYMGPDGQYTNNCGTFLGSSRSTSSSQSISYGAHGGITVGWGVEDRIFSQSELKATVTAEAFWQSTSSIETDISFSNVIGNGGPENQVLVTSLAMERFVYRVITAPPPMAGQPPLVGTELQVLLPHTSEHVTRTYDLQLAKPSLEPAQVRELERVFRHRQGDPSSFPRHDELSGYLRDIGDPGTICTPSTAASDLDRCDILTSPNGLTVGSESGPVSGTGGSVSGSIEVATTMSTSESWGVSLTLDVEFSAGGFIGGFSLGTSREADLSVSHGSSIIYGFELGNIDDSVYSPYEAYIVGFHHTYDCVSGNVGCEGFEVVTYWVQ